MTWNSSLRKQTDNKGQDMKKELIKYVMERADRYYYDDFPIEQIEVWIEEFFDKYQPERASEMARENVMRCSGLYGNIERLAEMTSPPRNRSTSNS